MTSRWARRVLAVMLSVAALAGCTAGDAATTRTTLTTTTLPQPDRLTERPAALGTELPDPGIAPGECDDVTYTPPAAPEPREGRLCLPEVGRHDVGLILVHGGGGISGDGTAMTAWSQAYLEAGYTTLAIDYTLFRPGDDGPVFPAPEQDLKAAVQFLRGSASWLGIDPEHLVVHGVSAGARLGSVALTTGNDPWFEGPTSWTDIGDHVNGLVGLYGTYDGYVAYDAVYYGGDEDDRDPAVVRRRARGDAIDNADGATGPAILFAGEEDWIVLTAQMQAFSRALRRAGFDTETSVVPDADHGYDLGTGGLTARGRQTLQDVLGWLDEQFPMD